MGGFPHQIHADRKGRTGGDADTAHGPFRRVMKAINYADAVIENGTRRDEIQVFGILAELPDLITDNGIKGPALLIIGKVAGLPFASGTIAQANPVQQETFA